MIRVLNAVCNRPWAIEPSYMRLIINVITGEHRDPDLARAIRALRAERPAALAMRQGSPLDGSRAVLLRDGVAIVSIAGPIVRRADFFDEMSGLTSLEQIARDVQAAIDSPAARAVLLEIDTPGGEVTGISELASAIAAARDRKPVWAYVEGMGASAGYWLASAAERVIVADTADVGSIGVVLAVRDPQKDELAPIEFVSSQSPHKRPDPHSDAGRAQYQTLVDTTAEVFVAAVARQRGVSEDTVLADYGRGGLLVGRYAVAAGLADSLGTFEQTLTDLAAHAAQTSRTSGGMAARTQERFMSGENTQPTADELTQLRAQLAARDKEVAEVKQALAEAAAAKRTADATALAETLATAGRLTPGEKAGFTALYAGLLADNPERAAQLKALAEARPTHGLTDETLPAGQLLTLPAGRTTGAQQQDAETDQAVANARAWGAKQNGKRP